MLMELVQLPSIEALSDALTKASKSGEPVRAVPAAGTARTGENIDGVKRLIELTVSP